MPTVRTALLPPAPAAATTPELGRRPRRRLLATLLVAVGALAACTGTAAPREVDAMASGPVLIATWPFGKIATDLALANLANGGSRLDAIETGIREVERQSCDRSVGLGGRPNAAGYAQLDACIVDGPGRRAGSVAGLEGIVHPISAARAVLEHGKHAMLVGEGARWFALERGIASVPIDDLPAKKQAWQTRDRSQEPKTSGHDTVTVLLRAADGHLAGGCSTSGSAGKLPGRVGDSPIFGGGLYVDDEVGAAGGTGIGENIMRYAATCLIVERMRAGMTPQQACEEVVHHIARQDPRGYQIDVSFIAIDKQGRIGAASSNAKFPFAVTTATSSRVLEVQPVTPR